ncbi:MAG: RNA polymerase sigma factor, partial [Pseudobacter sp.]|uniref:RNA polymerase sigma factor n=1 Tax=Pseudobacter sp. TaxID=2045420 RepID=UPI003F80DCF2
LPPAGREDVSLDFLQYQFTKIVENWSEHLQRIAFQITRNKQVTEDIVQEAFLELWKHRRKIIPENPVGWLSKAVTNLALKYIRKTNVQVKVFKALSHFNDTCHSDVEERLIWKERQTILKIAINKLPSQQQLVLHLSKEVGLGRQEIADRLQISPNTVKVHLLRAMHFVKENICFILLFLFFCACNNLFFKRSNTDERVRDLYYAEKVISEVHPEEWMSTTVNSFTTVMNIILR